MSADAPAEVLARIQKLLNLAAKNPNQHEAALAASKAQELLAEWNLTAEYVANEAGDSGRREDKKVEGGFYKHQRALWKAVAELNFCLYQTQDYREIGFGRKKEWDSESARVVRRVVEKMKNKKRHMIVGRVVNVRATIALATYLEATIERVTLDRLHQQDLHNFSNWAISFRKGIADEVIGKLEDKRRSAEAAERKKRDLAARAADGASTATSLTIADVRRSEEDANNDFLHGAGWSAKVRARREEAAKDLRRRLDAYTAWAKANPEDARDRKKDAAKLDELSLYRPRAYHGRGGGRDDDGLDRSAYWAGKDAGEKIGIDPQAAARASAGRIK